MFRNYKREKALRSRLHELRPNSTAEQQTSFIKSLQARVEDTIRDARNNGLLLSLVPDERSRQTNTIIQVGYLTDKSLVVIRNGLLSDTSYLGEESDKYNQACDMFELARAMSKSPEDKSKLEEWETLLRPQRRESLSAMSKGLAEYLNIVYQGTHPREAKMTLDLVHAGLCGRLDNALLVDMASPSLVRSAV